MTEPSAVAPATHLWLHAKKPDGSEYHFHSIASLLCCHRRCMINLAENGTDIARDAIRVYIKVHDPQTCKCQWKIADRASPVTQLPNSTTQSDRHCDDHIRAGRGATAFNSLFFLRPDGAWRNGLGESLEGDPMDADRVTDQQESQKLSDLVRAVSHSVECPHWSTDQRTLARWMDCDAELMP